MLLIPLLLVSGYAHVHPTVENRPPRPSETVVIRFKTKETLDGTYRAEAAQKGCATRSSRRVVALAKGRTMRLRIPAPRTTGWCAGTHKVTVYFKQTVRCPEGARCGDSYDAEIGSTRFTVGS
jgi:hypothetical protein